MARFAKYVVTFVFVAAIFWIAFPNRGAVAFHLFPLFEEKLVSVALIFAAGVLLGFIWGALIVWLNGADLRSHFRRLRRKVKQLEEAPPASAQSLIRNITP